MYSLLGVRKPTDIEVKGLQKVLMGLIDSSRIQDNRIDKLKKLVKNMAFGKGFTEAGFYTLKDMTKETITKIKMGFAGLALGATLTLTGCAGVQNPINMFNNVTKEQIYESGMPELVNLETVEDENGSYVRTTIKDVSSVEYSRLDGGNTKNDEAKEFILRFIVEEALDSIALDNYSNWESWMKNSAPKYIHSDYINEILSGNTVMDNGFGESMGGTGVILTDARDSTMPTLARDGSSRASDKLFKSFTMTEDPSNSDILYVTTSGSAIYPVKDEDAKPYIKNLFQGKEDEYVESMPTLNDGKDSIIQVDFTLSYTLKKEGSDWKIAGFSNSFRVLSGSLMH
jgi:hypothetical protein